MCYLQRDQTPCALTKPCRGARSMTTEVQSGACVILLPIVLKRQQVTAAQIVKTIVISGRESSQETCLAALECTVCEIVGG